MVCLTDLPVGDFLQEVVDAIIPSVQAAWPCSTTQFLGVSTPCVQDSDCIAFCTSTCSGFDSMVSACYELMPGLKRCSCLCSNTSGCTTCTGSAVGGCSSVGNGNDCENSYVSGNVACKAYYRQSTFLNCGDGGACSTTTTTLCTDNDLDGYKIEGGGCGAVDCNDGNVNQWLNLSLYVDEDHDRYTVGSAEYRCVGISTTFCAGTTYYSDDGSTILQGV